MRTERNLLIIGIIVLLVIFVAFYLSIITIDSAINAWLLAVLVLVTMFYASSTNVLAELNSREMKRGRIRDLIQFGISPFIEILKMNEKTIQTGLFSWYPSDSNGKTVKFE